jgi:hypothetical protein
MMKMLAIPLVLLAAAAAAAPAMAGPGQCYDAYGRPIGPAYDTDNPNYGFIDSVLRRGGSCTGVISPPSRPNYGQPNYYEEGDRRRARPQRRYHGPEQPADRPAVPTNPLELPDRSR